MDIQFFPKNKEFWTYHLIPLLIITLIQIASTLLWRDEVAFNLVGGLIWLPLFTLSVLSYRWLYKTKHWESFGISRTILLVIGYSTAAGFAAAIVMVATIATFFWGDMINSEAVTSGKTTSIEIITQLIISNGLQTQLFISAWIFIYITTTTSRRIKQTELNNLRLQNSLKEAQLTSLTNQLNPHFLFNALNNIRFMIHENPKKADVMITALSDILRYSLESSQHDKVALHHEIEIIERYIAIAKIQQEERLDFSIDINNNLHNYLIPPMTLQLLVENAIKHGLDNLQKGGKLQIEGSETVENLIFSVHNDMPAQPQSKQSGTSIGLRNIEQRLHLLYGDKAAMTLTQSPHRFSVQLTIPKEIAQ